MKKIILLIIIFFINIFPQQENNKSIFISANMGVYDIKKEQFEEAYKSKIGFSPSISIGLPFSTKTYLYGKVSYFYKAGTPILYSYYFQNGTLISASEEKNGTAKFKEWIYNIGILYNIFLSEDYTLGINSGIVIASINEDKQWTGGSSVTSTGMGLLGVFGGLIIERNIANSPISILGEIQYNYSRESLISSVGDYGGLSVDVGCRFYLSKHRKQ
jgi:hypothetical protein